MGVPYGTMIYQLIIFIFLISIPTAIIGALVYLFKKASRIKKLEERIAVLEEKMKR
ncbi:hypothetical protein [Ectobacillus sp. sgz5001026]|uniref:hypothetical protein n=1 Tax=Ectobacillus sp. sgz5001026 TaxID=3242473 RepID=UPI0036D2AE54